MQRETIKNFYGQVVAYIDTDERNGNASIKNFYGQTLAYYDADRNVTKNFYGQVVSTGNTLASFIPADNNSK